ncbi:hypothetical protein ACH3XW_45495 [Acanthocheilonema viteae]
MYRSLLSVCFLGLLSTVCWLLANISHVQMACEEVNDVNRAGGEPRNPGLLLRHLRTDTSGGKQTDSRENTDIEYVSVSVIERVSITAAVCARLN